MGTVEKNVKVFSTLNWQDLNMSSSGRSDFAGSPLQDSPLYDIAGLLGHDVEGGKRGKAVKGVLRFCFGVSPDILTLLESIHG
jgi:hypothetical protein